MDFGMFDVATSGEDEQRIASRKQADKLAAAIYDVREKHGEWLFGAKDLDGFDDRAKLAHVSICQAIEPHMHARTGVYSRVIRALKKEWRQRQAIRTEDSIANTVDQGLAPKPAPGQPGQPRMVPEHVKGPQLEGRRTACYPGCHEDEAHAKKFHKDKEKESRRLYADDGDGYGYGPTPDIGHAPGGIGTELGVENLMHGPGANVGAGASSGPSVGKAGRRHLYADDGAYEEHAPDHPELHTEVTYEEHTYEPLKPEGDFEEYKDSVDQGGPEKVDHDFVHGGGEVREHDDNGDHNFVPTVTGRRRQADMPGGAPPASTAPIASPTGGSAAPSGFESMNPSATPATTGQMALPGMEAPGGIQGTASRYSEYNRIARMIFADGDPTSMPAGAPVSGPADPTGGSIAGPGAGMATPPAPPTSASPAGSGTPVTTPMTASREYQIIAGMIANRYEEYWSPEEMAGLKQKADEEVSPETHPHLFGPQHPDHAYYHARHKGHRWANRAVAEGGTKQARQRLLAVCRDHGIFTDRQHQRIASLVKKGDRNYLQQADEALTKVLNEKAEEFQNTIAPLQQALVTIQQAEALSNPLNVSPPAGTVNVLPGQQQGQAAAPQGQPPQGGGGLGADPAAAGLTEQPAQQVQAKRGGQGKG
jgi:hypothetical protein